MRNYRRVRQERHAQRLQQTRRQEHDETIDEPAAEPVIGTPVWPDISNIMLSHNDINPIDWSGMYGHMRGGRRSAMIHEPELTPQQQGRTLRANWSMEMAQDLQAIHGIDFAQQMANEIDTDIITQVRLLGTIVDTPTQSFWTHQIIEEEMDEDELYMMRLGMK